MIKTAIAAAVAVLHSTKNSSGSSSWRQQWHAGKAYINSVIAATSDDHFLSSWRCLQLLSVLLGPIQQGNVASPVCVVLLSSVHLCKQNTACRAKSACAAGRSKSVQGFGVIPRWNSFKCTVSLAWQCDLHCSPAMRVSNKVLLLLAMVCPWTKAGSREVGTPFPCLTCPAKYHPPARLSVT